MCVESRRVVVVVFLLKSRPYLVQHNDITHRRQHKYCYYFENYKVKKYN